MSRGRPPAVEDEHAVQALHDIRRCVAENKLTVAELAYHASISQASAWRGLNTEPPRWTASFKKIHKFVSEQQAIAGNAPAGLLSAVSDAAKGKRQATARLLRAIADMLDERVF